MRLTHVLVDFMVFPPGHGRSVTDFSGWDAHETRLRCPDDLSGDIGGCSARRALKSKVYQPTQTTVTAEILPFRENSHGRAGNRTRDLMISSQRLWPLDHEAGLKFNVVSKELMWGFSFDSKQHLYLCLSIHSGNWVTEVFVYLVTATAASPDLTHVRSFVKKKKKNSRCLIVMLRT